MALLKRPNGTEDILPGSSAEWQALEGFLRTTAHINGFEEIRIPTFEQTELFSRGVGETTDVVQKEMYTVSAKESTFTLRPEGTAGTIRAMLQNGLLNEALPQRVYYILSCFRHERPQAGRLREFHQFGVEMAGSQEPTADADVIFLANQIITELGVKDVELHINSIGCPKCRRNYHNALREFFLPHKAELCETCIALMKDPAHDILSTLKGPDFPSGAYIIYDEAELRRVYENRCNFSFSGSYLDRRDLPWGKIIHRSYGVRGRPYRRDVFFRSDRAIGFPGCPHCPDEDGHSAPDRYPFGRYVRRPAAGWAQP